MWLKKKVVVPLSVFSKQLNKSKSIDPKVSEKAVNLTARMGNDHVVIEWQELVDEQPTEDGSGSGDSSHKLVDDAGDDASK